MLPARFPRSDALPPRCRLHRAAIADNLEVKKLVYLYLINYAKSNPDMTLMAVNSFVKDTSNVNPLIRALAIRTMGCIRVERITEHLCGPLRKALADEDPYVRKTAAMCVAKLYDIDPAITREQDFLSILLDLTADPVPIVVANAVAALMEVQDSSSRVIFDINTEALSRLLAALKDCSEWGQVVILDALSTYVPADAREAESVIERISPWLAHQNPAVVLNSVKVIILMMEALEAPETVTALCAKLAPPLVTLSQSSHPEIQYVALRNISLVVQRYPGLLSSKVRVFFCKYNEPIYVKMEKLEVLVRLATPANVEGVLMELREYAQEVDIEYVRRAVRTIGRLAIKLEKAAPSCIRLLIQLIKEKTPGGGAGGAAAASSGGGGGGGTDQNYLVQEAVIVIKDIFRRYPGHYEGVIGTLCEHLESLDEPEAKAALVWIIGEYSARIEGSAELLEDFLDGFLEEPAQVQLALLTATVKCYLHDPDGADEIVKTVLQMATEESDNPDLRDRGYIYWRLLAADPDAARAVVLADKPVVTDDTNAVPESLLGDMLAHLATLASVYHKPPDAFVRRVRRPGEFGDDSEEEDDDDSDDESGDDAAGSAAAASSGGGASAAAEPDFFGGGAPAPAPAAAADSGDVLGDLFGAAPAAAAPAAAPAAAVGTELPSAGGVGFRVGVARASDGTPTLKVTLTNNLPSGAPISAAAVRVNVNPFGLVPASGVANFSPPIAPGQSGTATIPLTHDQSKVDESRPVAQLQVAIREEGSKSSTRGGADLPYSSLFVADGSVPRGEYLAAFRAAAASEQSTTVSGSATGSKEATQARFEQHGVSFVAQRASDGEVRAYFSAKGTAPGGRPGAAVILVEVTHTDGSPSVRVCARTTVATVAAAALEAVAALLR